MSVTTQNMALTYPEYNEPQYIWAQLLENIRDRLSNHDHNIVNQTGLSVDIGNILINNNIYFQPGNDVKLGAINFTPENINNLTNNLSFANSLFVRGVDIYFQDGLNREIQMTSGGQLNQLTTFGGGFSGDFLSSGASVSYVGSVYTFLGSATQPTPNFSIIRSDNYKTENLSLPFLLDRTAILTVTNRSDFFDASFGFVSNGLNANKFNGCIPNQLTEEDWPVWTTKGDAGFAYTNFNSRNLLNYLKIATTNASTYQTYETGFKTTNLFLPGGGAYILISGMLECLGDGSQETANINFNTTLLGGVTPSFFGIFGCYGTSFDLDNGIPLVINQNITTNTSNMSYATTYSMTNGVSNEGTGMLFFQSTAG